MRHQIETYRVVEMLFVLALAFLLLGLFSPRNQKENCYPELKDDKSIDLNAMNR